MEQEPERESQVDQASEASDEYDSDDYSNYDLDEKSNYDPEDELTQDFCLIAPTRRERLLWDERGVLDRILFDGSASCLVYHFARPLFPLSLEPEEGYRVPFKLNKIRQLDTLPVREYSSQGSRKRPLSASRAEGSTKRQRSNLHLTTLPSELQSYIFEFLTLEETLTTGLTCKSLWNVAKFQITFHFPQYLGVWAGVPILCIGSWTASTEDSYPPTVSEEDKKELKEGLTMRELDIYNPEEYTPQPVNLHKLAKTRYPYIWDVNYSFPPILSTLASELYQKYRYPNDIFRITSPKPASFYPTDREWVLRNLTTREVVRSDAIALKPEFVNGPFIRGIGFGEVILSRTCWSTNGDVAFDCSVGIHRGVWAGHMLDIVPAETISGDLETWRDVSGEVAAEIAEIWRCKYGDEWRSEVIARAEI